MRGFGLVRSLNSAATDQHETCRSEGRRGRRTAAGVQASEGDVTDGFFFAQQTPCGSEREKSGRHKPLPCRRAKPGDDQSGRRTRRRLGERQPEQRCPVVHGRRDFKVVVGERMGEARWVSRFNAWQREQSGGEHSAISRCTRRKGPGAGFLKSHSPMHAGMATNASCCSNPNHEPT